MQLSIIEQAAALLGESRRPVIIIPPRPTFDARAAASALGQVLNKLGKSATIVCPSTEPNQHPLLATSPTVKPGLGNTRTMVIDVALGAGALESLSYEVAGDRLRIFLAQRSGHLKPEDIKPSPGPFSYDAIITLGVSHLEQLGAVYSEHAEMFAHSPVLNIDSQPHNTRYGTVVLTDTVATSLTEIIYLLLRQLGAELIDEPAATPLLAGIMSTTELFRRHTVTPRALGIASQLMTAGARRNDIIRALHQTKTVSSLKLWGRALVNMQSAADGAVVWSSLTKADFQATGAKLPEAQAVLDEFLSTTPAALYTCLFIEQETNIEVYLAAAPGATPLTGITSLVATNHHRYHGTLSAPMASAQSAVLTAAKAAAGAQPPTV